MRWYIPIGKHLLGINFSFRMSFKKRDGYDVLALSNKVDHRYCVFLDYDIIEETTITSDVKGLQKKFNLGNAYVFTTAKGFHVLFIDLVTYDELKVIMNSSSCDEHYKYVSRKNNNRQWVLRFTPKGSKNPVKFYKIMKGVQERPISYPHTNYLIAQGVPIGTFTTIDHFAECRDMPLNLVRYKA